LSEHQSIEAYYECVRDLIHQPSVRSMEHFIQHADVSCFEHSLFVSYYSFLVCRKLGMDIRSAARGALLHDFFLYDWHEKGDRKGLHGFTHPKTALDNANRYFELNETEQNIIRTHMWPLGLPVPLYPESWVVWLVDKCCTLAEVAGWCRSLYRPHPLVLLAVDGRRC